MKWFLGAWAGSVGLEEARVPWCPSVQQQLAWELLCLPLARPDVAPQPFQAQGWIAGVLLPGLLLPSLPGLWWLHPQLSPLPLQGWCCSLGGSGEHTEGAKAWGRGAAGLGIYSCLWP